MLYWLLSDEALQVRMIRAIREARTPLTALVPRESEAAASEEVRSPLTIARGVATIRVEGVLTPSPDMMAECYGEPNTTYPALREALATALADRSVREIVWDIDSPGGDVDGLFSLLDDIADARASGAKMRVIADNAHSAAYGIAAAAGPIMARSRIASFGSVGVATTGFISGGLCGKAVDITSSDAPEKRPNIETPEGRQVVVRYLDQIASEFQGVIARGRGVASEHVASAYGRGSSMLAAAAFSAGLIDGIQTRARADARTLTHAHSSARVPNSMAEKDPTKPDPEESEEASYEDPDKTEPEKDEEAAADTPVPEDEEDEDEDAPPAPPAPERLSKSERAELIALRKDRDARETAERRSLVTELVALGAERPVTAWKDGAPVPRLAAEPLADLRVRVAALRADRVATPATSPAVKPPTAAGAGEDALEDFERRDAAKIKDPEARARFVASRLARKQKAQ